MSVSSLGLIDSLQLAVTGLVPDAKYKLALAGGTKPEDLITFAAGIGGVTIVQTFGPIQHVFMPGDREPLRTLQVISLADQRTVLIQTR